MVQFAQSVATYAPRGRSSDGLAALGLHSGWFGKEPTRGLEPRTPSLRVMRLPVLTPCKRADSRAAGASWGPRWGPLWGSTSCTDWHAQPQLAPVGVDPSFVANPAASYMATREDLHRLVGACTEDRLTWAAIELAPQDDEPDRRGSSGQGGGEADGRAGCGAPRSGPRELDDSDSRRRTKLAPSLAPSGWFLDDRPLGRPVARDASRRCARRTRASR